MYLLHLQEIKGLCNLEIDKGEYVSLDHFFSGRHWIGGGKNYTARKWNASRLPCLVYFVEFNSQSCEGLIVQPFFPLIFGLIANSTEIVFTTSYSQDNWLTLDASNSPIKSDSQSHIKDTTFSLLVRIWENACLHFFEFFSSYAEFWLQGKSRKDVTCTFSL